MNFLVLFTESKERVKWVNNTNNEKKLQNSARSSKRNEQMTLFLHILFVSLFLFLFVTLLTMFKVPFFLGDYCKSETKEWSGKYVNDLFCKVYGAGQVQANNSYSHVIFGEVHFMTAILRTVQQHTFLCNDAWMIVHFENDTTSKDLLIFKWDDYMGFWNNVSIDNTNN